MKNIPAVRVGLLSRDFHLATMLSSALGLEYQIQPVSFPERAREMLNQKRCDVLLVDFDPRIAASESAISVGYEDLLECGVPLVIMADQENRPEAQKLLDQGAHSSVRKPPAMPELRSLLRAASTAVCAQADLEKAQAALTSITGFDQLKGTSAKMQAVYDIIRRVAKLDASVLVTGESGTGKELVARAIHNMGPRAGRPFVAISCGAIPETLIESELFGHEKGAFTGTTGTREGYFEQVGDGTLFLDEIGELSHATQVKLLRVLQQREFTRLGSNRPIPLKARVVFATHRDLSAMVAEGKFRQDLFYRINVMHVQVPSLRDRADDIPMLARHFLQRYSESYGKSVAGIGPDALVLLQNYSWPGNVRELENILQRALVMAEDECIRICDLPEALQALEIAALEDDLPAGSFERLLRDYKMRIVREALDQCNGNKTLAAQSLCISRAYLHRLIRSVTAVEEIMIPEPALTYEFSTAATQ